MANCKKAAANPPGLFTLMRPGDAGPDRRRLTNKRETSGFNWSGHARQSTSHRDLASGRPGRASPNRVRRRRGFRADRVARPHRGRASIRLDPYPTFDNFAWRAFVALNWPLATDAAHRGVPDRAKALGDPGPRVWETFKARYELFPVGPDGPPDRASAWATYDAAATRAAADVDDGVKTLASFSPFQDFNQAAFAWRAQSAGGAESHLHAVRDARSTSPSTRRSRAAAGARARTCPIRSILRRCPWARSRSRPRGAFSTLRTRRRCGRGTTWSRTPTSSTSPARSPRGRVVCSRRDVALVGLHIMVRTPDRPQGRVEHVRARRQRAPGRRGRGARARRQRSGHALFLFRRVEARARPLAGVRRARHPSGQHRPSPQGRPARRCRWSVGIRSMPRPWR